MSKVTDRWRNAWKIHAFKEQSLVTLAGVIVALVLIRVFLDYVETRPGVVLPDPLVPLLPAVDLKWITYSVFYSGILFGLISLLLYPFALLLTLRALVVLIVLRIVFLFLLPLDPPAGHIPLIDPFIQPPDQPPLTRDLFFSGHVATLALLGNTARWRDMKIIFFSTAVVVSVLFLFQHVHYTIDLVAAPCFAYVAYGVTKLITVGEIAIPFANNRPEAASSSRD